jgi:uncharacterized membrane protein YhaH (DUF805 family)
MPSSWNLPDGSLHHAVATTAAACDDGTMTRAPSRPAQRITRGPFVLTAIGIYFMSFASQVLLTEPVTLRLSVVPFALFQAILIGVWIALHRRRLRDAGRPTGIVIGVATIYALEIVLLSIVVGLMVSSTGGDGGGAGPHAGILQLFVILYLLTLLAGDPHLGPLQLWIMGFVVVMLVPVAIAVGFSIWAATRPSVQASGTAPTP